MGCNCIKEIEAKFKELYPEAESIEYQNIEICSKRVYSTIEVKMPNRKKPVEKMLLLSYCPHCGAEYEK